MGTFSESDVEDAALAWLEASGWHIAHDPEIVAGFPGAERADYGEVVLAQWRFLDLVRDFIVFEDDGGLAHRQRRWRVTTSSTPCRWRWAKRRGRPSWHAPTAWQTSPANT